MKRAERKLAVCAEKGCSKCPIGRHHVPEDCEYLLCHALDTEAGKIRVCGRQTGKTTKVMKLAQKLASAGYTVVVLVRSQHQARMLQRRMMGTGAYILSVYEDQLNNRSLPKELRGLKHAAVLSDEVGDYIVEEVQRAGHQFVMGFRS